MDEYPKNELSLFNGKILAPKVLLIRPLSKYFTSNSLIFDDQIKLVVDTGFQHGSGQLKRVRDYFDIGEADSVIFSHYHIDHTIGSYVFPQCKKLIHGSEKDVLESGGSFLKFCYQDDLKSSDYAKWEPRFLTFLKYEGLSDWKDLALDYIQSFDIKKPLDLGEIRLEFLYLPGHSPGHCGLYEPESKVLFIGDIDLSKFGPWYGWRNTNLQSFRQSIVKLQEFIENNSISIIVPSHSSPIENKQECLKRLSDFNNIFDERKRKILDFITKQKAGTTISELTKQSFIYQGRRSQPQFVHETFERFMVEKHLEELELEKLVLWEEDEVTLM